MSRRPFLLRGLTPLLDTLFLLLFALLVATETRATTRAEPVRVRLPEVEAGEGAEPAAAPRVALAIDAGSRLFVAGEDREIATRDELDRLLAERLGDRLPEELVIEIRADAESRSGVALELLQHLLLRGFVRVELLALASDGAGGAFGGERGR